MNTQKHKPEIYDRITRFNMIMLAIWVILVLIIVGYLAYDTWHYNQIVNQVPTW